jgi:DNA-binding MarR family transcriptional regulator
MLALTTAGRRAVRRSQAVRRQAVETLLHSCTAEELAEMARSFERFNNLLE